jgi:chromosome segregation ATPase
MPSKCPVGYTCRSIDSVINVLKSLDVKYLLRLDKEDLEEELRYLSDQMEASEKIMEEIRSANSDLRTWGEELYEELDSAETKLSILENDLSTVEFDLENVTSELENLKVDFNEVNDELDLISKVLKN